MNVASGELDGARRVRRAPSFSQGLVEKAFPALEQPFPHAPISCTERIRLALLDLANPSASKTPLRRGLFTGALCEAQLYCFASGGGFLRDLRAEAERLFTGKPYRFGPPTPENATEVRDAGVTLVRDWMGRFPAQDDGLDWAEVTALPEFPPQREFALVNAQSGYRVKVRPDIVVGVGDCLVAVELTTSKAAVPISPARYTLNTLALRGVLALKRAVDPDFRGFRRVVTRVELLAQGHGYTIELTQEDLAAWRLEIDAVCRSVQAGSYAKHAGAWCQGCWLHQTCWPNGMPDGSEVAF